MSTIQLRNVKFNLATSKILTPDYPVQLQITEDSGKEIRINMNKEEMEILGKAFIAWARIGWEKI